MSCNFAGVYPVAVSTSEFVAQRSVLNQINILRMMMRIFSMMLCAIHYSRISSSTTSSDEIQLYSKTKGHKLQVDLSYTVADGMVIQYTDVSTLTDYATGTPEQAVGYNEVSFTASQEANTGIYEVDWQFEFTIRNHELGAWITTLLTLVDGDTVNSTSCPECHNGQRTVRPNYLWGFDTVPPSSKQWVSQWFSRLFPEWHSTMGGPS